MVIARLEKLLKDIERKRFGVFKTGDNRDYDELSYQNYLLKKETNQAVQEAHKWRIAYQNQQN